MVNVIIINGQGGVGKDTFVDLFKLHYQGTVYSRSFVEEAKRVATLCGWTGEKSNKDRKFLSDITRALTAWRDLPFMQMINFLVDKTPEDCVIFYHIREPQDILRFSDVLNEFFFIKPVTVLVTNSRVESSFNNPADDNVGNYNYDYVVDNSGSLDHFENSVITFVKDVFENSEVV